MTISILNFGSAPAVDSSSAGCRGLWTAFFGNGDSTTVTDLTLWNGSTGKSPFLLPNVSMVIASSCEEKDLVLWRINSVPIFGTETGTLFPELHHERVYKALFLSNEA